MAWKSVLKPENSIVAGLATAAVVVGIYELNVGPVAQAQATPANHPVLETSRKKAGYTSLAAVAGIALLARDPNIFVLGGATIIAMELSYRHAIMAHPDTGEIVPPNPDAYTAAQNVVPINAQAGMAVTG